MNNAICKISKVQSRKQAYRNLQELRKLLPGRSYSTLRGSAFWHSEYRSRDHRRGQQADELSHSISFDQLMPVFLSEPISHQPVSLPFQFSGGFGFSSKTIGFMLSIQGVYSMIAQLFIFPHLARSFGPLKTFRTVIFVWPLLYFLVPYVILLPALMQKPAVYVCLLTKITFQVTAFPSNAILLTNSAPSTHVLGVINGVAASTASLARAFGPTVTGVVHVWGLNVGCTGLAWWISGLICAIGAVQCMWMQEVTNGRMDRVEPPDEEQHHVPSESLPRMASHNKGRREHLPEADEKRQCKESF